MAGYCPDTTCSILLNSRCVYYESSALPNTGINTNDSLQVALQKIDEAIGSGGGGSAVWGDITGTITDQTDLISYLSTNYVNQDVELTINGVTQDLSTDRSWTVGDMILASVQTSTGKKSFTSDGTNSGLRLIPFAGTPSTMAVGDLIFNSTEDTYVGRTATAGNISFLYSSLGGFVTNSIPFLIGNTLDGAVSMSSSLTFNGSVFSAPETNISGPLRLQVTAADTGVTNGQLWYNSTTHNFRGRLNGVSQSLLTTASTVGVVNGGTGLTTIPALSIWVANALDTITTVTPGAGQSIRINAGNTAWEAYTPGSGGISNTAIVNEIMKSDGTNAVPSGFFSTTAGSLIFGSASIASTTRTLSAVSTGGSTDFSIVAQGAGNIELSTGQTSGSILAQGFNSTTNAVVRTFKVRYRSTAFPIAIGVGSGLQFEVYTAVSTNVIGAAIDMVSTNVTGGTEAFNMVFNLMTGGVLAEALSLTSGSSSTLTIGNGFAGTSRSIVAGGSAGTVGLTINTKGSGSVLTLGVGNIDISLNGTGVAGHIYPQSNQLQIIARSNTSGYGLYIGSGNGTGTGTSAGNIIILSGGSSGTNVSSGHVYIHTGTPDGSGTAGNIGLFTSSGTFGSGQRVAYIANALVNASSTPTDGIIIHARDSSDGSANSTLALYTEQVPEASAIFTQTHRIKVWWNNTEYWLSLDAV
jgi:hypothetical protein